MTHRPPQTDARELARAVLAAAFAYAAAPPVDHDPHGER